MVEENPGTAVLAAAEPPTDDRLLVKWLEEKPADVQEQLALDNLHLLLEKASQPRHASGNSCIKLCYYIEQCRNSSCTPIQGVAFSKETCLKVFNFYIEWNEKNQHRSMRQVVELLCSLIARNPSELTSETVKQTILEKSLSILSHQTAQSLVKPAFKALECLLHKNAISPQELLAAYKARDSQNQASSSLAATEQSSESLWDSFILGLFDWMSLSDISPAAGKFIVTLFKALKPAAGSSEGHQSDYSIQWQRWIRNGLAKDSHAFENVKNYLFPPLFKIDRPGSLTFLESLNQQRAISDLQTQDVDAHALLQLAAMDVGKKAGLVVEPSTNSSQDCQAETYQKAGIIQFSKLSKKSTASIILQEKAIGSLMCSASDTIRSLAFSVLVSSASSIRPFSPVALALLRAHLGTLYSDTDAKFRNETLTNTKNMIERIRGATQNLARELDQASFKLHQELPVDTPQTTSQQILHDDIGKLLVEHETFVEWYLQFLLGELISTASYQRHITSLKAIGLMLQSRILEADSEPPVGQAINTWPFTLSFFTPRSMRLLMDLLMDPFEDVRVGAADILAWASRDHFTETIFEGPSDTPESLLVSVNGMSGNFGIQPASGSTHNLGSNPSTRPLSILLKFIERAKDSSKRTGRADYADGVARSYRILYGLQKSEDKIQLLEQMVHDLECKVEIATNNLARAVIEAPVHANFSTLNLILDLVNPSQDFATDGTEAWGKWDDFIQRMVRSCSGIWEAVKNILCNDSPEGHLPQDIEELDAIDTKDVLSYSFRAVHESSNLMRTIVNKLSEERPDTSGSHAQNSFAEIGDLSFLQLSTLRHRGAFSTVSLTFAVCCQLTQNYNLGSGTANTDLLWNWWKGTVAAIHSQASTTRRSAGIPALITGIMSANAPSPSFEEIMADLKLQARSPVNATSIAVDSTKNELPQVHALNGLREIFKDSVIRKRAENHVLESLHIASDALNAETWAIRNCGLLLFQSLINYLIGTQSKQKTEAGWDGGAKAISYDKYPGLGELLFRLLETAAGDDSVNAIPNATETIFPVLDILRRAGPPEALQDKITTRLLDAMGHKLWHIRDLSARTLCVLTPDETTIDLIQKLISSTGDSAGASLTENQRHGALLGAKLLLERYISNYDHSSDREIQSVAPIISLCFPHDLKILRSPFTLTAYTDLQNTLLAFLISLKPTNNQRTCEHEGIMAFAHESLPASAFNHLTLVLLDCEHTPDGENSPKITPTHIAAFKRAVYLSAINEDIVSLQEIVALANRSYGVGILIPTLESIAELWIHGKEDSMLHKLACLHIALFEPPISGDKAILYAAVLNNLFLLFEAVKDVYSPEFRAVIKKLNGALETFFRSDLPINPSLGEAIYKILGIMILSDVLHTKPLDEFTKKKIRSWGFNVRFISRDEQDFDTRCAAIQSLKSFFRNQGIEHAIGDDCLLGPLFALYDTMNDDDDEIRELGASAVTSLTGNSSTPLQARQDLANWMSIEYRNSAEFASEVLMRTIGKEKPRFPSSLDRDDSLFVEESLNLFVDEVREIRLWAGVFSKFPKEIIQGTHQNCPLGRLSRYVVAGLEALDTVLEADDGSLGRYSDPVYYATCLRILISANGFLRFLSTYYLDPGTSLLNISGKNLDFLDINKILIMLQGFLSDGIKRHVHEDLIFEILSPQSLKKTKLDIMAPGITGIMKTRLTFSLQLRRARLGPETQ
ncbi:tRNA (cytidine(32)-2'-O)-methyltransferase non-catalytic subunit TRM732 [Lachnellula suecica]|uniref:tRNA (Cytidine(32)-2'-O)-methyltransferase non-catalytic subunit TRM732 n=1 Tax=Lachnellula suecica TaxID=602035 RepID=A0A8T9CAZ6_9HELO|nr:tRNA (cytidine(32)-2'-O)-methyltransferase non-catalytic subunit TRM732 [Lachnellula suecica]